jgi:hypothetical protein
MQMWQEAGTPRDAESIMQRRRVLIYECQVEVPLHTSHRRPLLGRKLQVASQWPLIHSYAGIQTLLEDTQ